MSLLCWLEEHGASAHAGRLDKGAAGSVEMVEEEEVTRGGSHVEIKDSSPASADLLPLDFLSRVLPQGGQAVTGVRLVQDGGVRGAQLSGPLRALSFPSSQIFINCEHFPTEFSVVVTMKVDHLAPKVSI